MALRLPSMTMVGDRVVDAATGLLPPTTSDPRLRLWRTLTLPFWYGSDVPAPSRPRLQPMADGDSPASRWLWQQLASLERRFWWSWIATSILRGGALGGVVGLGWLVLATIRLLPTPTFFGLAICIGGGVLPGFVFGLVNRPGVVRIATMLDRTFRLDERLITALDSDDDGSPLLTMQRADAANALSLVSRDVRPLALLPIRECVHALLVGSAIVTIWMFSFDTAKPFVVEDVNLPGYYPAAERLADDERPLPNQRTSSTAAGATPVSTNSDTSTSDRVDPLQTAFAENELTQPAANALDANDPGAAADALSGAAPDIANAPQDERDRIADSLDRAAADLAESDPGLAETVSDAADDIRAGGEQAEQGVQDLSDAIDQPAPGEAGGEDSSNSSGETGDAPVGEQQPGNTSDQSPSEGEPGGESGESSQGDPGSGAAAEPGTSDSPAEGESGAPQSGGESSEGDAPESSGSGDTTSTGNAEGEAGESGEGGQPGNEPNPDVESGGDAPEEGDNAGSGPPSDSSTNDDPTAQPGAPTDAEQPTATVTAEAIEDAPPGESQPGTGTGGTDTGGTGGTLKIGGASDETVQSGNDASSASQGSGGGGAPVGSGDASSQVTGPAGPDSNVVPTDVEDVVSGYFGGPQP